MRSDNTSAKNKRASRYHAPRGAIHGDRIPAELQADDKNIGEDAVVRDATLFYLPISSIHACARAHASTSAGRTYLADLVNILCKCCVRLGED